MMADVVLLDGGLGEELIARSGGAAGPLWSTRVMIDRPGLVRALHADYFAAGARVATVNSYALHRDRLAVAGLEDSLTDLVALALAEARAARDAAGGGVIAGSIGPLVGSYRPEAHPPHAEAVARYAEVARLIGPGVDLVLAETVASLAHARAVLEGAAAAGRPVWISVTVDDEDGSRLRSGEAVADLAPILRAGGAQAVLANCSAPEAMPAALRVLAGFGMPFGAYANAFRQTTKAFLAGKTGPDRPEMTPALYADHALGWVALGATLIGGCCGTTPAHIAEIARRLRAAGHRIVDPALGP